eukprot:TRINITY_DN2263_c0_g1_i4.p2 TRINITY_DN2263_c0_g1~~TRINITY_DN2263_c0_g1_i4.p2  ORF type:complete len:153 (+),score=2.96 TRINITY_DN2263_c0_g1_i4:114-572(+)
MPQYHVWASTCTGVHITLVVVCWHKANKVSWRGKSVDGGRGALKKIFEGISIGQHALEERHDVRSGRKHLAPSLQRTGKGESALCAWSVSLIMLSNAYGVRAAPREYSKLWISVTLLKSVAGENLLPYTPRSGTMNLEKVWFASTDVCVALG